MAYVEIADLFDLYGELGQAAPVTLDQLNQLYSTAIAAKTALDANTDPNQTASLTSDLNTKWAAYMTARENYNPSAAAAAAAAPAPAPAPAPTAAPAPAPTAPVLASIVITPSPATAVAGGTVQFTAVGKDASGNTLATQPSFSWYTTSGSITSGGLYTAPSATGTDTVICMSGGISATVSVTVTTAAAAPVSAPATPGVVALSLTPQSPVSIGPGGTIQFHAAAQDSSGRNVANQGAFAWSANSGTINAAGYYTAPSSPTTDTVTVTSGGMSTSVTVNVQQGAPLRAYGRGHHRGGGQSQQRQQVQQEIQGLQPWQQQQVQQALYGSSDYQPQQRIQMLQNALNIVNQAVNQANNQSGFWGGFQTSFGFGNTANLQRLATTIQNQIAMLQRRMQSGNWGRRGRR